MPAPVDAPVHIPEPALRAGGLDSFGRQSAHGAPFPDRRRSPAMNCSSSALANPIDDPHPCLTGRTFEVCLLDQLQPRLRLTEHMVA
jgi:hypothetical protein